MGLSTFLNNSPVTQPRGVMWLSFSDTAVIQNPMVVSDSGGGGTTTYVNAGTVACRVYPVTIRGKGAIIGGQINELSTHFCSMPPDTDVNIADRLLIANRGTFEVTITLDTTDPVTTRVEAFQIL